MAAVVLARLSIGALVLWTVAIATRASRGVPSGRWPRLLRMSALSTVVGLLLFAAVERIPASTTTLLLYAHPAIVAVIAVVLGRDRMSPAKLAGLLLGLGGVVLILGAPVGNLDPAGVALALGAAFVLALYVVTAQRGAEGMASVTAGAIVLSVAALLYAPIGIAAGGVASPGSAWWWVALLGIATGGGIWLFLAGLARLGPIRATIGATVEPVAAVVLATAFLGERLAAAQLVGGALVVAAVALLPRTRISAAAGADVGRT